MASGTLEVLDELAAILERLGLRFAIGGSLASGAWGEPRSTYDIDLLVALPEARVPELFQALKGRFYVDESAMREAVRRARSFNVIHLEGYQKVDVFVAGDSALDAAQLEAPVERRLGSASPRSFPVTAPEVIVLRKLDWFRQGGEVSERQWRDVLAVLRVQTGRLNVARMRRLAEDVGLAGLMDRATAEAEGREPA